MRLTYLASEADTGRRVFHILKGELRLSATQIKRLKAANAVYLNGENVFTTRAVSAGDIVEAELSAGERAPDFPAEPGELEILYESPALLAVNKPSGMLVHPSRARYTGTLANYAAWYLAGRGTPHAVNRLDRDTSGVVLFAKSAHFKTLAVQSLLAPESEKEYFAYLCGELPQPHGVIDLPIERAEAGGMLRRVSPLGKPAVTEYEVERTAAVHGFTVSAVRFVLHTGRTHQIRVHTSHLGAPILGDELYGSEESRALSESLGLSSGQLLHARRLRLADPFTGEHVEIEAPVNRPDMEMLDGFFRGN